MTDALTLVAEGPLPVEALAEAARRFEPAELAALVVAIIAINAWNRLSLAAGLRPPADGS